MECVINSTLFGLNPFNLSRPTYTQQPDIGRKSIPNTVGFYSGSNNCAQNTTHSKSITAEISATTVREEIENESSEDRAVDLESGLARVDLTEGCSNAERDCHQFRDEENSENDTECKNNHEVVLASYSAREVTSNS